MKGYQHKRRNGTPLRTLDDFIQYAVDIIKSSGGTIVVNEYKYIRCRTLLKSLAHARKAGVVCRRRSSPPQAAEYFLKPIPHQPQETP